MIQHTVTVTLKNGKVLSIDGAPSYVKVLIVEDTSRCVFFSKQSKENYSIAVEWCVEDVISQAEQLGKHITTDQAIEILDSISNDHDSDLGITWTTIECALEDL